MLQLSCSISMAQLRRGGHHSVPPDAGCQPRATSPSPSLSQLVWVSHLEESRVLFARSLLCWVTGRGRKTVPGVRTPGTALGQAGWDG